MADKSLGWFNWDLKAETGDREPPTLGFWEDGTAYCRLDVVTKFWSDRYNKTYASWHTINLQGDDAKEATRGWKPSRRFWANGYVQKRKSGGKYYTNFQCRKFVWEDQIREESELSGMPLDESELVKKALDEFDGTLVEEDTDEIPFDAAP